MVKEYKCMLNEDGLPSLVCERTLAVNDNFSNPEIVADFFQNIIRLGDLVEEHVYEVAVNCRLKPIAVFECSHGSNEFSFVDVKALFSRALLAGASGIIMAHNHPSQDVTPSSEDEQLTRRVIEAGRILGIRLQDHLVISKQNYCSIREWKPELFKEETA